MKIPYLAHLCSWYILVKWICAYNYKGFECGSEASGSAGQSTRLWQTATSDHTACIYLHSLLSSPVLSFPLPFSSVRMGEERQIRLLPQKLPITARQYIQRSCLRNAEFVRTVKLKGCEFNLSCCFEWIKYCRCVDIRVCTVANTGSSLSYIWTVAAYSLQLFFERPS